MTQPAIKTAIIGYGFSAKTFHIPFIVGLDEFELCAISTSQKEAVEHDWPQVTHYSTASELLSQSDAELVIITAPNDVHFALAKLALENNKHVVLEKPFVTKLEDGQALIELAAQQQRILSVYHNRRWDGDFLTAKMLITQGQLGDVKSFESHFDRFRPQVRERWREQTTDGGGILFDLGSHLIDQALQLFGLPQSLSAQCLKMRDNSINVDYFNIVFHYADKQVTLHGDLYSPAPNKRFTIKGSIGSYEKLGLDPQEARLIAGVSPTVEGWGDETKDQYGLLYNERGSKAIPTQSGSYQNYFVALSDSIRKQGAIPVDPQDALWTIKLIELAMESSRLGKTIPIEEL
jgi:predicted dehydrogenase